MSMEFTVEYYETVAGQCPVRDFLDELEADARMISLRYWLG